MHLTPTQKATLLEFEEFGGRLSGPWLGVSRSTVRGLERLGLLSVRWGERRESLAPQGWTGRTYVTQYWGAELTEAGREAIANLKESA